MVYFLLICFVNNMKHYHCFLICIWNAIVPKGSSGESEPLSTPTNNQSQPVHMEAMMLDQDKDKINPLKQTVPSFYSKSRTGVFMHHTSNTKATIQPQKE